MALLLLNLLLLCAALALYLTDRIPLPLRLTYFPSPISISASDSDSASDSASALPQCAWKPDPGPCQAFFRRFYYNQNTHCCETFVYGGCGGQVPFRTSAQCEQARCHLLSSRVGAGSTSPPQGRAPWRMATVTADTIIDYVG